LYPNPTLLFLWLPPSVGWCGGRQWWHGVVCGGGFLGGGEEGDGVALKY